MAPRSTSRRPWQRIERRGILGWMPATSMTRRYVGRGDVLTTLDDAIRAVRAGGSRTVLVTGEPGIGKTRTLEELAQRAERESMRVLLGRSHPADGAPAYWPWAQVLREFCEDPTTLALLTDLGSSLAVLADGFPELREQLPNLGSPPELGDEDASRFRLFQSVATVLRRSARKAPLLVVFEDLHWADDASLQLLGFFRREVADAPVLVAASYRDVEVDDAHPLARHLPELTRDAAFIVLAGLSSGEVADLVSDVAARPSAALARRLLDRTGGNPLFVLETARVIASGPDGAAEADELMLPEGIRHALRDRVGRLSSGCRRMLEVASTLGDEFGLDLLSRASEGGADPLTHDEVLAALAEGVAARLVSRSPGSEFQYGFAHALVREMLYEELGPVRQAALHAEVASALEQMGAVDDRLAELAHHYCRAAPAGHAEQAVRYAKRAGDEARGRWAHDEAAALYDRALDVLRLLPQPEPRRQCDLLLALGQTRALAGDREGATRALTRSATLAREWKLAEALANVALSMPASHTASTMTAAMADGDHRQLLEEALAALSESDGSLRARLLARLSGFHPERATLANSALEMARRTDDPGALVAALDAQHFALWNPRDVDGRLALALEMERVAQRTGNVNIAYRACHAAMGDLLELGDRRTLRQTLDRMEHLAAELRQPGFRLAPMHARAGQTFLDGDLEGFERMAQEALALAQSLGAPDALAVFGGQLSMLRREQDRLDEIVPPLRAMIAQFPDVPVWRISLAWVHSDMDRHEEARAELASIPASRIDALPHDGFWQFALHMMAETSARLGDSDRERVLALYTQLLPCSGHAIVVGPVLCFGSADRSLAALAAALGREDEARWHFDRALGVDAALEAVPCLAHTRVEYARFLIRSGSTAADERRAAELVDLALEAASRHGLARVERLANDLRAQLPADAGASLSAAGPTSANAFVFEGDTWLLRFGGREARVRATRGMEYLARLLAEPGRDLLAADLAGLPGEPGSTERGAAGSELLDPQALREYRQRLDDLREELARAEAAHDAGRITAIREEMGFLEQSLSAGTGLGGRTRHAADAVEKARKAVYNRVRASIKHLVEVHPPLGRHLERSVRTGTLCSYHPEVAIDWELRGDIGAASS